MPPRLAPSEPDNRGFHYTEIRCVSIAFPDGDGLASKAVGDPSTARSKRASFTLVDTIDWARVQRRPVSALATVFQAESCGEAGRGLERPRDEIAGEARRHQCIGRQGSLHESRLRIERAISS